MRYLILNVDHYFSVVLVIHMAMNCYKLSLL